MAAHQGATEYMHGGAFCLKKLWVQSSNQRDKVLLRQEHKSLSEFGKRLLRCNNGSLRMHSKRHKPYWTFTNPCANFNLLGTCSSEQHKVCEEDNSQCRKTKVRIASLSPIIHDRITCNRQQCRRRPRRESFRSNLFLPWWRTFFG